MLPERSESVLYQGFNPKYMCAIKEGKDLEMNRFGRRLIHMRDRWITKLFAMVFMASIAILPADAKETVLIEEWDVPTPNSLNPIRIFKYTIYMVNVHSPLRA